MHERGRASIVALALFSSGFASLALETLWFRQARLAFGSTVWASAIVLAAFMLGIGVGGALARTIPPATRRAWLTYAGLELVVALSGPILVQGLPALGALFAPFDVSHANEPWLVGGARLAAALMLLLVPCAAMGMTIPLVVPKSSGLHPRAAGTLGLLYGANTVGAAAGALSTELIFVEQFGVSGAGYTASVMSLLAALLALTEARRIGPARPQTVVDPARAAQTEVDDASHSVIPSLPLPPPRRFASLRWWSAAALVGAAMLALEQLWLRLLLLFLNDTPLLFALVLALMLGCLSAGSLLVSVWLTRFPRAEARADLVAYAGGAGITLGLLLLPHALARFYTLGQGAASLLLIALPLLGPTSLASGALFPLLARAHGTTLEPAKLTFVNAVGGALGALLTSLFVLPALGMERGFLLAAAAFGLAGALLTFGQRPIAPRAWGALTAFVAALCLFPFGAIERTFVRGSAGRWMSERDRILAVREDVGATLVHVRHRRAGLDVFDQLATNAYSMSADHFAARRYMRLFAHLPLALHPGMDRALVIGYGLGSTAQALTEAAELSAIDVVDTSEETLRLARATLRESRGKASPLDDPRVRVHIEDGRHYLQGTEQRYDLITGEPPPPFSSGVENLYAREYFALLHDRLAAGGFATYWLPLLDISASAACSIVAAFCAEFEDCSVWHGSAANFILLGRRGAREPVTLERYVAQWEEPSVRTELVAVGLEHPAQLGALFIGDAAYLATVCANAQPLSDDTPRLLQTTLVRDEREQLLWKWRDTAAARQRFLTSRSLRRLLPAPAVRASSHQFENQRLLNDLLWSNPGPRQLAVLDQVLRSTPLTLPVLLILDSDPDMQRALRELPESSREPAEWTRHRLAGALARRDFASARTYARRLPAEALPLPGLRDYLERGRAELTRSQ